MKLAVPEHLKLLIKTIDEAAKLINDPRATGMNILVVMKNPIDAPFHIYEQEQMVCAG